MKIAIIIVKLLFLGALFIISNHALYLNNSGDRESFFYMYYSWLDNLIRQGLDVTAYVVKFEWLPVDNNVKLEFKS